MIKIKVFPSYGYMRYLDRQNPISLTDYQYCVYLFGFIVHSVNIEGVTKEQASRIFKDKWLQND